MKTPRVASESSTTSDNTAEFIDIVKKYDIVYNTHNPDYKNVEVKMKVWTQIANEIGLSVDAAKRKWKNLRDSYTKYLRSFRTGTKTSKKYQFWAHAEHMVFLRPYQGPGRNPNNNVKTKSEEEDNECDLGYQVLTKASTNLEDDISRISTTVTTAPIQNAPTTTQTIAIIPPAVSSLTPSTGISTYSSISSFGSLTTASINNTASGTILLPVPSLPHVPLPPQLCKSVLSQPTLPTLATTMPTQIFPQPQLPNIIKSALPITASSTSNSVGCLIIEPQLFASADTFKKELGSHSNLNLFQNTVSSVPVISSPASTKSAQAPSSNKIRRVQPSPQTAAINLSFSATTPNVQPPQPKVRKLNDRSDIDISAILQANRDLDANTLFFLSLAKTVRSMPTKFQSLAKMRCMRIVSDIELELENAIECNGSIAPDDGMNGNSKYCSIDTPPPPNEGGCIQNPVNEGATEHFVYVMSPSRVESMIDISSDEESGLNGK
ncbi:uncharacterized protein LOC119679489 [Teleopsis dalmanni]|uniref:uncharacterized protein LOC119679489 n=1 Tax=Teleopsis dalmanni TaxID=139649 RepID=UPI0018CEEEDB|nr:uncharacterized protein LOC119679489 [Teleopsis dalmanni]